MKKTTLLKAIALILFATTNLKAETRTTFSHTALLKKADNIALVTEGESIDGELTVLASYRGSLSVGTNIKIPLLRDFSNQARRVVQPSIIPSSERQHAEVSGRLMILFLKGKGEEMSPAYDPEGYTWLCWIEDGMVYAYSRLITEGDPEIMKIGDSAMLTSILRDLSQAEEHE